MADASELLHLHILRASHFTFTTALNYFSVNDENRYMTVNYTARKLYVEATTCHCIRNVYIKLFFFSLSI